MGTSDCDKQWERETVTTKATSNGDGKQPVELLFSFFFLVFTLQDREREEEFRVK